MNIEKTISEHAVSDILTPMLESQDRIVTEDVAPLFDQATGLDTPPASGTVTTTIEESRSVITAIIRKAWTATLTMLGGASVLSSLAAAYTYLRNRLQGNETYGIPDRRSEISASSPLAANLALLNDRKIGGVPEAVDGMSLVQIIHSAYAITELTDNNTGWVLTKSITNTAYPSLNKLHIGCKDAMFGVSSYAISGLTLDEFSMDEVEQFSGIYLTANQDTLRMPKLKKAGSLGNADIIHVDGCKVLDLPEFDVFNFVGNCTAISGDSYEQILMRKFRGIPSAAGWPTIIAGCSNLWKVVWGKIEYGRFTWGYNNKPNFGNCPNLIHLEFGQDIAISINIPMWNPSYVLSDNPTGNDLVTDEGISTNLDQFLQNFKEHIALRLTSNGSGKTLTLSQAVFDTIWNQDGTPKSTDPDSVIYQINSIIKTDKHWSVNRA